MGSVAMNMCMYCFRIAQKWRAVQRIPALSAHYTLSSFIPYLLMAPYIEKVFIGIEQSGLLALGARVIVLWRHTSFVLLTGVGRAG